MYGIHSGLFRYINNMIDFQVAFIRRRRTNIKSFIRIPYMHRIPVDIRIYCYSFYVHFPAGTYYTHSNFTPVGYKYFFNHMYLTI